MSVVMVDPKCSLRILKVKKKHPSRIWTQGKSEMDHVGCRIGNVGGKVLKCAAELGRTEHVFVQGNFPPN